MNTTKAFNFQIVFIAACIAMLLFGIILISLGSILPDVIIKYNLDNIQAGSLAAILPAGILAGSIVFGPVADRYSYKYLFGVSSVIIIAGLEGMAFAPGLFTLQLSVFLIGIGGGALNGGANALVADISEADPDKRSANLSLLGVFFGIGALGVPSIMALLSSQWDYNIILILTGLIIIIPLMFFFIISFPAPKHQQAIPLKTSLAMFKDSYLVMLGIFLFFQSALEGVISNWTTTFLQNIKGFGSDEALLALSAYVLSLTIARLLLAGILRRYSSYLTLMISLFVMLAGSLLLIFPNVQVLPWIGLILFGLGAAAGFPVILGYVGELYTDLRGTAFSFVIVIALLGNMMVNYIMGMIAHQYDIGKFPLVLMACIVFLLLITWSRISKIIKA